MKRACLLLVLALGCERGLAPVSELPSAATVPVVRKWGFVLVDLGGGVMPARTALNTALFDVTNPKSARSLHREMSYGLEDIDGQVLGPFTFSSPAPDGGAGPAACPMTGLMAMTLKQMITDTYEQYLWYFGTKQAACGWAALATGGTADRPTQDSWLNNVSSCVTVLKEPMRNFGLQSSSSIRCMRNGVPVSMIVRGLGNSCTHSEYGNVFDPMGNGCFHYDGFQKASLGWLSRCNVVKVTASGDFTLLPLESACGGVQLLQIPLKTPRDLALRSGALPLTSYYLELRAPIGIDATLAPQVLVTVAADIPIARGNSRNWLVDMTPETAVVDDAALAAGKTFADPEPGGPRFTVVSVDATRAVIHVDLDGTPSGSRPGVGVCRDESPFTGPGPQRCADAPMPPAPDGGGAGSGGAGTGGRLGDAATGAGGQGGTGEPHPPSTDRSASGGGQGTNGTGGTTGTGGSDAGLVGQMGPVDSGNTATAGGPRLYAGSLCAYGRSRPRAIPGIAIMALCLWTRKRQRRAIALRAAQRP